MLISFTVENYKSIRDSQTLSMEATTDDHLEGSRVVKRDSLRLLKSAAIYGPNASGKSTLVSALAWAKFFILTSDREGLEQSGIDIDRFRLQIDRMDADASFEFELAWKGNRYRYGFQLNDQQITAEWLFRQRHGAKPARLFTRENQSFDVNTAQFKKADSLTQWAKKETLFLTVCAKWNVPEALELLAWFRRLNIVSGLSDRGYFPFTAKALSDPAQRSQILRLARSADLHISGISSELTPFDESVIPKDVPPGEKARILKSVFRAEIKTSHQVFDKKGKPAGKVEFDLEEQESEGTKKFIALSGPLLHTMQEGSTLVIDEFEARLHPLLTKALLTWFLGPANHKGAQLILVTHDTGLMEPDILRRDQIWFCEKDEIGATSLYSLAEFDSNKVRPTTKFNRQYLLGIFGAVPKLAIREVMTPTPAESLSE